MSTRNAALDSITVKKGGKQPSECISEQWEPSAQQTDSTFPVHLPGSLHSSGSLALGLNHNTSFTMAAAEKSRSFAPSLTSLTSLQYSFLNKGCTSLLVVFC